LGAVILKAIAKDPNERFQDAESFCKALKNEHAFGQNQKKKKKLRDRLLPIRPSVLFFLFMVLLGVMACGMYGYAVSGRLENVLAGMVYIPSHRKVDQSSCITNLAPQQKYFRAKFVA
jgi:hypothetical protein